METWLSILIMALCLVAGVFLGFAMDQETICDCPTCPDCVCPECPTIEPMECECEPTSDDWLNLAIEDFLDELEEKDDLRCGRYEYDMEEISVSRIYDRYSITVDDDETTVEFEIKLKYDEDDERSCRQRFEVEVFYEEGEDPEINYCSP